jgi:hypothetical protein
MALSWVEDALSPSVVMADLDRAVPEFVDGRLVLLGCRINRIRALPGTEDAWKAVYALEVRDAATGVERTVVTEGLLSPTGPDAGPAPPVPFGDSGWRMAVPELRLELSALVVDDTLPGLTAVLDPQRGPALLGRGLREGGWLPPGAEVTDVAGTVVTHKPRVRATILCRLAYAGEAGGAPSAVVVKVHHDDQGRTALRAMEELSRCLGGSPAAPRLARAIAYLPELHLSIQEHVPHERSLKELFGEGFEGGAARSGSDSRSGSDELLEAVRACGAGLAHVHQCDVPLGEPVTWEQELAVVAKKVERLVEAMPTVRAAVGSVPDRLRAAAERSSADPLLPAHHSFRPAQVLLTADGVAFIDFDKFCRAEAGSDISLFTTKMQHMAANKVGAGGLTDSGRQARSAELVAAFVGEYQRHAPVSEERLALWQALRLTSLVLSAAKQVNATWTARCGELLDRHLEAHGW